MTLTCAMLCVVGCVLGCVVVCEGSAEPSEFSAPSMIASFTGGSPPLNAFALANLYRQGRLDVAYALGSATAYGAWGLARDPPSNPLDGPWAQTVMDNNFSNVRGIAAGDLNGDNILDVAIATESKGVEWNANLGGGTFSPGRVVNASLEATWVAPVDLDGDLDVDLCVATSTNVYAVVNEGNGDSWGAPVSLAPEDTIVLLRPNVVVTDVDGTGAVDLVGVGSSKTTGDSTLWVFPNPLQSQPPVVVATEVSTRATRHERSEWRVASAT